jgi:hypothetical protein
MDRDRMNDGASAALGLQTRELTEVELEAVSGGMRKAGGDPSSSGKAVDAFSFQWGVGAGVPAIIAVL